MRRLLNKEPNELGMMQVACNRPIMLPLAVSKGNRNDKPWGVFLLGEGHLSLFALNLLYVL